MSPEPLPYGGGFVVPRPAQDRGTAGRLDRGSRPSRHPRHEAVTMARMRVCSQPGCPELTTARRCPECATEAEARRGSRQQRGYDAAHEQERKRWAPRVQLGGVHCHATVCLMPTRLILFGQLWDLGHTDDRTAWTGPEHATCNRSAGGRAAHGG